MGKQRTSISSVQLIVSCALTLINTCCLIAYSLQNDWPRNHLYLTKWSLYFNSFFMIAMTLCDIMLFMKNNSLENFNDILRNKIGPSLNGVSHVVMLFYWILLSVGGITFTQGGKALEVIKNLYTHGFISFFLIADIFVNHRERLKFEIVNVMGVLAFYFFYAIIIVIECYINFKEVPYPFMDVMSPFLLFVFVILVFVFMILGYLANIGLVKLKYKFNIFVDESANNQQLNSEITAGNP